MSERAKGVRRAGGAVCTVLALAAAVLLPWNPTTARAAAPEPDYVLTESEPPHGGFEGPCGVAVAPGTSNQLYVSDYYNNAIKIFNSEQGFVAQLRDVDPLSGPCALAVAGDGSLYVNSYHRHVEKFTPSSFPVAAGTTFSSAGILDSSFPTGVAVDPPTGTVYVNARTHVAVYDSAGAVVLDEGEPLRIGEGSLEDGYGLAISTFPGTQGRVYVPDAGDRTIKVYDPLIDTVEPLATIDGSATPGGEFVSLRDASIAVDRVSGEVYVVDNLQPEYTERPQGVVYVFGPSGDYRGRLKFNVIHGGPSGLAVDNSALATQGRVYVTSGNTENGSVYAYPPGSATSESRPAAMSVSVEKAGSGTGSSGGGCAGTGACVVEAHEAASVRAQATPPAPPVAGASEIAQKGKLRVTASGRIAPRSLPRAGVAPIAVSVGGKIATTDGSRPPQLKTFRIELNRHGRLNAIGLPVCPYGRIQPAPSKRALSACRSALVGHGRFWADIALSGQEPYPTKGRLLVFNGRLKGRPVLLGHIFSRRPFASSFVIVFAVRKPRRGAYGAVLTASLPRALGNWGNLTGIQMTLSRRFRHRGSRRSFLSAGCPAPKGFPGAVFPFGRASFAFAQGNKLSVNMTGTCRVRR